MIFAKKSLGQNFLIDQNIIKKIINLTNINKKNIVEIGSGKGALTDEILKKNPKSLIIIEKDINLAEQLKLKYTGVKNVKIFNADILNFNIEIIKWCINFLNLKTELVLSSQLNLPSEKIEKIIDICKNLHADEYLSAVGSKNYINGHEDIFKNSNIKLMFHNYEHPRYKQLFGSFCDYACILDLIFNEGDNSLEIIKSGNILN